MARIIALLALFWTAPAFAQVGAPFDCSGTVGTASAAIVFSHPPALYVLLANPSATATLAVNPTGAAVVGGSGSITLNTSGVANDMLLLSVGQGVPPWGTINIIASAASTPFSCKAQ